MKKIALILLSIVCSMSAFTQAYSYVSPESVRVCSGEGQFFVIEWEASEFDQTALEPSSYSFIHSETEEEIVDIVDSVVQENSNKLYIYVNVSKAFPGQSALVAKYILKQADDFLGAIDVELLASPSFELSMEPKEPQINDEIKITANLESGSNVDDFVFHWNEEEGTNMFTTNANDYGKNEISCKVTSSENGCVIKKTIEYTVYSNALLSPESASIEVGGTTSFALMRDGVEVTNEVSYWVSSDADVATVSDGVVVGVGVGTAEIYAYNGDSQILGEALVVVTEPKNYTLNVDEDTVIYVGDDLQFQLYLNGELYDGTGKVRWNILSDDIIAEINNEDGLLSATKKGSCIVVAKVDDEVVAKATVNIETISYEIVIEDSDGVIGVGETAKLQLLKNGKEDVTGNASWSVTLTPDSGNLEIDTKTAEITGTAEGTVTVSAAIGGNEVATLQVIVEMVCNAGKIMFESCGEYCYYRDFSQKFRPSLQEGDVLSIHISGESSEDGYLESYTIASDEVAYCRSDEDLNVEKGTHFDYERNFKITKTPSEDETLYEIYSFYSYGSNDEDVTFCLDDYSGDVTHYPYVLSLSKEYRMGFNEEEIFDEYSVVLEVGDVCQVGVIDRISGKPVLDDYVEYTYYPEGTTSVEYSEADNSLKALALGEGGVLAVKFDGQVIGVVYVTVRKAPVQGETFTWDSRQRADEQSKNGTKSLELGSEYVFDIVDESGNGVTVVNWESYSDYFGVEDGRVIARQVGDDRFRAVMSNDSIIECYFEVEANTDKWTYQDEYSIYVGDEVDIEILNADGFNITKYLTIRQTTGDWFGNFEDGKFHADFVGEGEFQVMYPYWNKESYSDDYKEVGTIKIKSNLPYKLVGEPKMKVNGDTITLSLTNLDGEIQKLDEVSVYANLENDVDNHFHAKLSKDKQSVQVWATGYSSFEGDMDIYFYDASGNMVDYSEKLTAAYEGVEYGFPSEMLLLTVGEEQDFSVYAEGKPVELPAGWYFYYDEAALKIADGKIVSNSIGQEEVLLISDKDEVAATCWAYSVNADGYCLSGINNKVFMDESNSCYPSLLKFNKNIYDYESIDGVEYVSGDTTIVKVKSDVWGGIEFSPLALGKATIYAVYEGDSVASKDVTVCKAYQLNVNLTLDSEPVSIASLIDVADVAMLPEDKYWYSYSSEWQEICSIKDGLISPHSYGAVTIREDSEQFRITVTVSTVGGYFVGATLPMAEMPVQSATIGLSEFAAMEKGANLFAYNLNGFENIYPTYVPSREGVVEIRTFEDEKPMTEFFPTQIGKTTIYAVLDKDTIGWVDITVLPDLDTEYSLSLDATSYEMYEGESVQACITVTGLDKEVMNPEYGYDETIVEYSEFEKDENICVSIAGLEPGTTDFTVTAYNGLCSATATVTVKPIEYEILGNTSVEVGETTQYSLTANDQEYGNGVTWSLEETELAEIDGYGVLTAKSSTGSVIVYAIIDEDTVATKTVEIAEFTGEFTVMVKTKSCAGAEGTGLIECSKAFNKDYFAVLSVDGSVYVDFDGATATIDYANLLSGSYEIVYAGKTVGSFGFARIETPKVEIIPTVEDGNYIVNTEYEFKAAITEGTIKGDAVVYGWNVVDENNPESNNNVSFRYDDSLIYVTFLSEGDYTIKGNVFYEECSEENSGIGYAQVSVTKPVSYYFEEGQFEMTVGDTKEMVLYANDDVYGAEVEWNILSDNPFATISDGVVYALAEGTATIEAKVNGERVATATLSVKPFEGIFTVTGAEFCSGAEGKATISCSVDYNTDLLSIQTADGAPVDIEFDESDVKIDYSNLSTGDFAIVYAGQIVDKFFATEVKVPSMTIKQTVEDGKYLTNTEYEFYVEPEGESMLGEGETLQYKWAVTDESNPESQDNIDYQQTDKALSATFMGEGYYTINCDVIQGECIGTVEPVQVYVEKPVTYHFEYEQFEMTVGDVKEMVLYANDEVYYGNIEWKVEDFEDMIIAEMDEYGYLHANYEGVTTIYAIIDTVVAKATVTINPSGYSKSLGFTEPGYSVVVNGTNEMCLEMYGFKSGYEISYEISNPNAVACEFNYNTNCFVAKGLTEGRAMLYVTLLDGEDKYTASAAISIMAEEKPVVHFEQEVYQVAVGEEVIAKLQFEQEIMLPDDDQMTVSVENGTYAELTNVENYFVAIKGIQEGTTNLVACIYGCKYTAMAKVVIVQGSTEPKQMEAPLCKTDNYICFSKEAFPMDMFAAPSVDYGKLQWYTVDGKALDNTPVVSGTQVGTVTYFVSQVSGEATIEALESEKVPVSVTVDYVAEPALNIYDQKICNGKEAEAFVAKSQYPVQWASVAGEPFSNEMIFTPQESGEYIVYAFNEKTGCPSTPISATVTFGTPVVPEIEGLQESYSKGEPIKLATSVDETIYDVVWDVDGSIYQGQEMMVSYPEVGEYAIICKTIEKETSCVETAEVTAVVSETVIPVKSISVAPEVMNLFIGEKEVIAVNFEPSYATNKNYTIQVEDEDVANVSGSTVYGLGKGTTKAIITSVDNADAVAEIIINVDSLIHAREISMPNIITMAVGEETMVQATVLPNNSTNKNVLFREKSDTSVVKITPEGKLTAVAEGTTTIVAYVNEGLIATAVVYVTSEVAEIESIQLPEKIEMMVGESLTVPVKVTPTTLAIRDLTWAVSDASIVSFENGVVKAQSVGTTTLTVAYKDVTAEVSIVVSASSAPVVVNIPEKVIATDGKIEIDLSKYVTDDNTDFKDLNIAANSENLNVEIVDGIATITPKNQEYAGKDIVEFTFTDADGMSSKTLLPIEIMEVENLAPVIKLHKISFEENCNFKYIDLYDIAEDDLTEWQSLKFTFKSLSESFTTKLFRKTQLCLQKIPNASFDVAKVLITVSDGVNTTQDTLFINVESIPNMAPVISAIPVQNETDDVKFGAIQLANYVTDDYTTPSAITWKAAMSENLAISIVDGVASVKVLNEFWKGAESVMFYAADEQGLTDSVAVYYVRNVTVKTEQEENIEAVWEGAPVFDIISMRSIGTPGQQFVLMANISGFNGSFAWTIDGANGIEEGSLMQMVTFNEPGEYDVTFTIMSADGQMKSLTKEKMLTVIGIDNRQPQICKGQSITLNATEGLDSYYWTSNDVKSSATVRPDATMTYAVIMKKGLFTFTDSVSVKVSVPVTLMEDSVMCAGTTFELAAQGEYESYSWNTGATTSSIMIPDQVASYTVFTIDDMNCASIDTFNLTKVNPLPIIDLGKDQTPCDGEIVTLDAGEGFEYLWSNGLTDQKIALTEGTNTMWARIIDNNKCVNYDTVTVTFTYPYPEQIGVATFSETTDHIILAWEKTAGVNTVSYRIERETNFTDNWEQVGDDVMFNEPGFVVDEDVNYKQRAYKYRLVTIDGCGNEAISEVHRSMIATYQTQDNGLKTIQWLAYEPMSAVTQYIVLRGTDPARMDTVDYVPASNDKEIWNETNPKFKNDTTTLYRVVFRLKSEVNENAINTIEGLPIEGYYTKAESGPFSLAMSNIAEAENTTGIEEIPFADVIVYPTQVSSVINVAIAAADEENFTVELVNANGQVITTLETGMISKTLLQIPAEGLTQGIYGVRVSTEKQTKTIQVVK